MDGQLESTIGAVVVVAEPGSHAVSMEAMFAGQNFHFLPYIYWPLPY
jgi:hypothetical protein